MNRSSSNLSEGGAPASQPDRSRNRINLSLDLRLICILLLATIVGMLLSWQPWSANAVTDANVRTIRVNGEAVLKAEPDEYVFYPTYTVQNPDQGAALAEMQKKSQEIITGLKRLGLADSQIKSSVDSFGRSIAPQPVPERPETPISNYTLQLTVTVSGRSQAQKVQDYLTGTTPTGTITPNANFSTTQRKGLEDKARDQATKDARAKAEQSGKNLGFRLGKVRKVEDGSGFNAIPYANRGAATDMASPMPAQLNVQPGENELRYSVSVEYFVR